MCYSVTVKEWMLIFRVFFTGMMDPMHPSHMHANQAHMMNHPGHPAMMGQPQPQSPYGPPPGTPDFGPMPVHSHPSYAAEYPAGMPAPGHPAISRQMSHPGHSIPSQHGMMMPQSQGGVPTTYMTGPPHGPQYMMGGP